MSATPGSCPDCGTALAGDGICRRCLVAQTLEPEEDFPEEPLGQLGDYEILEKIAHGGMGVVYRARQLSLNREVAVKLVPEGRLASEAEVQRFRMEAEAAGELDHPNIVPVYEVGEEDGQHFFSMRLVEGGTLANRLDEFRSPEGKTMRMLVTLARSVHFAHQRGILHRDLKPSNILIDDAGEPQITDFGLAKRVNTDSSLTVTGQVLGSPAYIAPELLTGGGKPSVASDVYSLGVIVFQMVAGHVPFEGTTQLEVMRQVADEPPPRLRETNRDLETICFKCLEKDPAKRYRSAGELADDLERCQRGEAIAARPVSLPERVVKWSRRKPALAALAGVVIAAAVALFVVLIERNARIAEEKDNALESEEAARESERTTRRELYASDMAAIHRALEERNLFQARELLRKHVPEPGQEDLRGFEWRYFWEQCQGEQAFVLDGGHEHTVLSLAFSEDGRRLVSGGLDGRAVAWDLEKRQRLFAVPDDREVNIAYEAKREIGDFFLRVSGRKPAARELNPTSRAIGPVYSVMPDFETARLFTGSRSAHTRIWKTDRLRAHDWLRDVGSCLARVPGTRQMLVGKGWRLFEGQEEAAQLFDMDTLEPVGEPFPESGGLVRVAADGQVAVTSTSKGMVRLYTLDGVEQSALSFSRPVTAIAVSPDGSHVAFCVHPVGDIVLWDWRAKETHTLKDHRARAWCVAFSPDGGRLASGSSDQSICIWDVETRKCVRRLRGHTGLVNALAFSPDGEWLASGGGDRAIRLWNYRKRPQSPIIDDILHPVAVSPDGRFLAGKVPRPAVLVDLETGERRDIPVRTRVRDIEFSEDGSEIVLAAEDAEGKTIGTRVWNVQTGAFATPFVEVERRGNFNGTLLPGGKHWASGMPDGDAVLTLSDTRTGEIIASARASDRFESVHTSIGRPDGRIIAQGGATSLRLLERDGTVLRVVAAADDRRGLNELAVSTDGRWLAVSHSDGTVQIRDAETLALERTLIGHLYSTSPVAFSPDGRTLASASEDGTLRLWSLSTGRALFTLESGPIWHSLIFTPDGRRLIAVQWGGKARIWRAPTLEEIDGKEALFR